MTHAYRNTIKSVDYLRNPVQNQFITDQSEWDEDEEYADPFQFPAHTTSFQQARWNEAILTAGTKTIIRKNGEQHLRTDENVTSKSPIDGMTPWTQDQINAWIRRSNEWFYPSSTEKFKVPKFSKLICPYTGQSFASGSKYLAHLAKMRQQYTPEPKDSDEAIALAKREFRIATWLKNLHIPGSRVYPERIVP